MCLWAPHAPESPAKELGFADTQMPACAICPSHSACLANPLPLQITTSSLEYPISTEQLVTLHNNPGNCFVPQSRYCWAVLGALPPFAQQFLSSPAMPWCHLAHCSACDGVISPLSINPTGSSSPWLFPAFPRLPDELYHPADKGILWFPQLSAALCHLVPSLE